MDLTYTAPQARRCRNLAEREDFQEEDGTPSFRAIAAQAGVSEEACRYILTGQLPEELAATGDEDAAPDEEEDPLG